MFILIVLTLQPGRATDLRVMMCQSCCVKVMSPNLIATILLLLQPIALLWPQFKHTLTPLKH